MKQKKLLFGHHGEQYHVLQIMPPLPGFFLVYYDQHGWWKEPVIGWALVEFYINGEDAPPDSQDVVPLVTINGGGYPEVVPGDQAGADYLGMDYPGHEDDWQAEYARQMERRIPLVEEGKTLPVEEKERN